MGQLFGRVSRPQSPRLIGQKSEMAIKAQTGISYDQSIDNSLMSSHKKFQPDWSTNGLVVAKKRMPLFGIIGILETFRPINWSNINIFQ